MQIETVEGINKALPYVIVATFVAGAVFLGYTVYQEILKARREEKEQKVETAFSKLMLTQKLGLDLPPDELEALEQIVMSL